MESCSLAVNKVLFFFTRFRCYCAANLKDLTSNRQLTLIRSPSFQVIKLASRWQRCAGSNGIEVYMFVNCRRDENDSSQD
ncbi:hypothetical protein Q1695_004044 [Nippostrongylus brasiliensis]|nr:hypothetical protein Q1695_004044 [Nippostrongylus brasiliensis]